MGAESAKKNKISVFQQKVNSGPEFQAPEVMFIRKKSGLEWEHSGAEFARWGTRFWALGHQFGGLGGRFWQAYK